MSRTVGVPGAVVSDRDADLLRSMYLHNDPQLNATLKRARERRWTLAALSTALGITRQAVDHRVTRAEGRGLPIADPPRPDPKTPAAPRPRLAPEAVAELRRLHRLCGRGKRRTARSVNASRRLDELLELYLRHGLPQRDLAAALGVKPKTISARLYRSRQPTRGSTRPRTGQERDTPL